MLRRLAIWEKYCINIDLCTSIAVSDLSVQSQIQPKLNR